MAKKTNISSCVVIHSSVVNTYSWAVPLSCMSHFINSLKSAFNAEITHSKTQISSLFNLRPSILKSTSNSMPKNCKRVAGAIFFISLTFPSEWMFQSYFRLAEGDNSVTWLKLQLLVPLLYPRVNK